VTKWGPTVTTDKPPQDRFSGLRSGFRSEMTDLRSRKDLPDLPAPFEESSNGRQADFDDPER
jgi:hypothetical protein